MKALGRLSKKDKLFVIKMIKEFGKGEETITLLNFCFLNRKYVELCLKIAMHELRGNDERYGDYAHALRVHLALFTNFYEIFS